jgi:signal transduction histidine kinase
MRRLADVCHARNEAVGSASACGLIAGAANVRKHAPGQPVTLGLGFEPGYVTVSVANPLPAAGHKGPLAESGAGAGLTGLKERAALAGGTFEAGPADGIWRVDLTIPT